MNDFHCHLDLYPKPLEVFAAATKRNDFTLAVTTSPKAFIAASRAFPSARNVAIAPGLHPEIAHQKQLEVQLLLSQIQSSAYVGEIGLDGSPRYKEHWGLQLEIFRAVVDACAKVGGRVVSIHSRRAATKVLDILEASGGCSTAILHWFSGTTAELRRALELGCWFSVGPAIFASQGGQRLLRTMPPNRVVTETDGPFARRDGAPLMPWDVELLPLELGRLWKLSAEEAARVLSDNANTVRNKAAVLALSVK